MRPFSSLPSRHLKNTVFKLKGPLSWCSAVQRNVSSLLYIVSYVQQQSLLMGSSDTTAITPVHKEQGGSAGSFLRGLPGSLDVAGHSWPHSDSNRGLGLGSSDQSLDFAGDIVLCSAEPLPLDVKLLQRKGHNLTELAHSVPQNSTFQALVICKPSHNSSSGYEGRDSFPLKVLSNNHKT